MRDRVAAVLAGKRPDGIPFIDRMELWYQSKIYTGGLPDEFKGMSLNEVHAAVGIGRQKFTAPYAFKLHGVEVVYSFENEIIFRNSDMVLGNNLIDRVKYIANQIETHPSDQQNEGTL